MPRRERYCRSAFIVFSLFEYLISLLVTGAFLAAILKQIGIADAIAGIVSSIISLSCVTQLFSGMLIKPDHSVRRTVVTLIAVNQLMFSSLYLIPFIPISQQAKTVLFVLMIAGAYFIDNLAHPIKYDWFMGFVDSRGRGRFTARKEMISLIGGMLFTLAMGRVVDYFNDSGHERTGFILCGMTIALIAVLCFTLIKSVDDAPQKRGKSVSFKQQLRTIRSMIASNSCFRKLLLVDVLWKSALYVSTPFFGTYLIGELSFSLTAVSLIGIVSGLSRVLISPIFGRYADRHGYAKAIAAGFALCAAGYLICSFARPGTIRLLYIPYAILDAIALASVNGGLVNITYEYLDRPLFAYALGAKSAISGVVGFLVSLLGSAVVRSVQAHGSLLFGRTIYAQQILSVISFLLIAFLVLYIRRVVCKLPRVDTVMDE